MKTSFSVVSIALLAGFVGGLVSHLESHLGSHLGSQFFSTEPSPSISSKSKENFSDNPFQTSIDETDDLFIQVDLLQQKIASLENKINSLSANSLSANSSPQNSPPNKTKTIRHRVTANKENLSNAGINNEVADELLQRIGQQDYRRLQLQNLIQRSTANERRQYSKELRELNKNKISLRTELGEDIYDTYLFNTGQNNRVSVSSVIPSSPAESSGLMRDDIIVYYDNQRILNWADLRTSTLQGNIDDYTNIEVLRDGTTITLTIPRGTLGVELEATQLDPSQ